MKSVLLCLLVFSSGKTFAAPKPKADSVQVNETFKTLIEKVIQGDEFLESAELHLDPKYSHLERERIRHSVKGFMKTTPWTPGKKAEIRGQNQFWMDRSVSKNVLRVEQRVEIDTDVIELFKHAATQAKKEKVAKPKPEKEVNESIESLLKITSLKDLHEWLKAQNALSLKVIDSLATPKDDQERKDELKRSRLAAEKIHFEPYEEKGQLKQIRMRHLEASGLIPAVRKKAFVHEIRVDIESNRFIVTLVASVDLTKEEVDDATKELDELFNGLATKEKDKMDETEANFSKGLDIFRSCITGKRWDKE